MNQQTLELTFNDVSGDLASRYAHELRDMLLDATPDIEVERERDKVHAQDLGNILSIVIPTVASIATAASTVIIAYIRYNRTSVKVTRKDDGAIMEIGPLKDEENAVRALALFLQGPKDHKQDDHIQND